MGAASKYRPNAAATSRDVTNTTTIVSTGRRTLPGEGATAGTSKNIPESGPQREERCDLTVASP